MAQVRLVRITYMGELMTELKGLLISTIPNMISMMALSVIIRRF